MRAILALLLLASLLAGCSDDPADGGGDPHDSLMENPAEGFLPACEPADMNNYGTQVQDLYVVDGGEVWRETNGIHALQKTQTCEGPADTRVSP